MRVDLHVYIKFVSLLVSPQTEKNLYSKTPEAKHRPANFTLAGCVHFYGVGIKYGDICVGGSEAENVGITAQYVSAQQLENSTELQATKENVSPPEMK